MQARLAESFLRATPGQSTRAGSSRKERENSASRRRVGSFFGHFSLKIALASALLNDFQKRVDSVNGLPGVHELFAETTINRVKEYEEIP